MGKETVKEMIPGSKGETTKPDLSVAPRRPHRYSTRSNVTLCGPAFDAAEMSVRKSSKPMERAIIQPESAMAVVSLEESNDV